MMPVPEFDALKESTTGVIILGAIGSLLATGVAFSMRKATQWDFGWMSAYCDGELTNTPIFVNFLLAHVSKILLLCTITISMVVASVFSFSMTRDLLIYGFSIASLSVAIYTFIVAYPDYKSLKINTQLWIDQRKKEQQKRPPATKRTGR